MTGPRYFDLPVEIRLQIYAELLVQSKIIIFPCFGPKCPLPSGIKPSVNQEILHVNKTVHNEASHLLYSKNRFHFCCLCFELCDDNVTQFVRQIGSQRKLVCHVCINIPSIYYTSGKAASIARDDLIDLGRIQGAFTGITTEPYQSFIRLEAINLLDTRFKAIPLLEKIVFKIVPRTMDGKDMLQSDLVNRMHAHGWIVEVIA